ncbi:hypothetical protein MHYP_G00219740 [Metynnis hypsauchen]
MPSSVDKHSMITAPQNLSATLQAVAHTCSGRTPLGRLSGSLCPYTVTPCNGSSSYKCSALAPDDKGTTPSSYVADWYWVCGHNVYIILPEHWGGRCAFTLFTSSLILVSHNPLGATHIARRNKRSSDDDFPPPEHRLKSKIAKFWECLFPQYGLTQVWNQLEVTHYRLATFANATRAALQGVKDELTALRLTTVQNRMALDLLLAKEGGVCAMVGDSCCTYIPANDEDHGAISVALDRMQRVSTQLQLDEHGGCLMERVYALASSLNPQRSEYIVMSRAGPSAMHPTGTPP